MAKIIAWSQKAENSFGRIVFYLADEWNDDVIEEFALHLNDVLKLLSEYPEIGTIKDNNPNVRSFLITKHNRLFYRTTKIKIILLNIFDTRMNPKRRKY